MGLINQLNRFLQPIRRRIALLLGRALLISVDDSTNIQLIRLAMLNGEEKEGVERMQPYGLSTVPPVNSEVLIGAINGSKDQVVAIVTNNSSARVKNQSEGDVVLHRDENDRVWIKLLPNNKIEINGKSINVTLEGGGKVDIGGNLTVDQGVGIGLKKLVNESIITLLNSHVHTCAAVGAPSGPALAPGPLPFNAALHATSKTKAQ